MSKTDRRERERAARRKLILDAAREMFVVDGYDAVTLRRVAERVEYSTTAIYAHFKDKQALIEEIVKSDFDAHRDMFVGVLALDNCVEQVQELGRRYVRFGLLNPNHYQLMFMTSHAVTKPSAPGDGSYSILKRVVSNCLAHGCFRKDHTDVASIARMLWSIVHGIVALDITKGHVTEGDAMTTAEMTFVILEGMFAESSECLAAHRRNRS